MPEFTENQKEAIYSEGSNIIVSAGAGSGKTMVLTERVIRKIIENKVGIDELLILTFTNDAAHSMKEKIREKLIEHGLRNELNKLDSSHIATFDSYSLSLVRKYHYLINVKRDINIIDSNLLNIKTKEFLDEVMNEEYQNKRPDFTQLIEDFCVKDDNNIIAVILYINNKLNLKYNKKDFLDNYVKEYYSEEKIQSFIDKYLELLYEQINVIDNYLTKLSYEVNSDYFAKISDMLTPVLNSKTYEEIKDNVNKIEQLPTLRGASKEGSDLKKVINKYFNKLKELTTYQDINELVKSIKLTKPYAEPIIRIIKKLDEKIENYKFENDLYDFIDISKLAIKIVKENKEICEEIKNSFNEIMVDEYQDTSDLQEEFINTISNNNVYTVGDVKQSIYRFRNANPDNFRDKYNNYTVLNGGKKVDLLDNFRSRNEVVNGINLIFNHIMSELIGGADYVNSHQMVYGNKEYNALGNTNQNNNLEIYSYPFEKGSFYTKEEIEAFIIADDIKEKVNSHYQVYDKKKKALRDIKYSDFAILVDVSRSFNTFKKVFLYKQIPLSIYQDEKLTDSEIFYVIRNIFKLIALVYDNNNGKEMEYCFLSIGRSFLFNYSDEELFEILTNKKYNETDIFEKINRIVNNISSKSISMILDEVINEFNIYEYLRKIPGIESNYIKLEYMYSLASNLNNMGYTFRDFDEFLENVLKTDDEIKFSMNKETGESAKILTIHKSKGLEYPICYCPGLYGQFNNKELQTKILYNNELGIVTPYNDNGMDYSFLRELYKRDYSEDEVSEKIRLFYVAATRAKEKLIFIAPEITKENEEYDNNDVVLNEIRLAYRSFLDILASIKSKLVPYVKEYTNDDINNLHLTKAYKFINSDNLFNNISKTDEKIETITIPIVTPIKKEESHFSKTSSKIFSKLEKEKMEFGTNVHYYLETLDLQNPVLTDIDSPYKEKIESFLKIDLLKDIKKAKVYQEYEFVKEDLDEEKHGVIDLMLEYPDHINIIDYKLKNIDDEAYVKQLNGYKNYIEKLSNKKVNTYLYSIMDSNYKKID